MRIGTEQAHQPALWDDLDHERRELKRIVLNRKSSLFPATVLLWE